MRWRGDMPTSIRLAVNEVLTTILESAIITGNHT
jgi:hypothetical protein